MSIRELLRLSFSRLRTSRLRAALTMLGVIIGVASVVALVGVGQGTTSNITSRLAGLRSRLWGWHLGDQAIFVRRDIFDRLRGYRDIPIFEDLDFSRRLRALGKTITLTPPAYSSARRFAEKGPLRTTWDDLRLTRQYLSGVDPNELCLPGVHRIQDLQTYERLS